MFLFSDIRQGLVFSDFFSTNFVVTQWYSFYSTPVYQQKLAFLGNMVVELSCLDFGLRMKMKTTFKEIEEILGSYKS